MITLCCCKYKLSRVTFVKMQYLRIISSMVVLALPVMACPLDAWYLPEYNMCFWATPTKASAETSDNACKADDGTLAVIPSAEINTALTSLYGTEINSVDTSNGDSYGLWISVTDKVVEGQYKTWGGDDLTFLNWRSGQPNDDTDPENQDCVRIKESHEFKWSDKSCDDNLIALCSASILIEISTTTSIEETTTTTPGTTTSTSETTTTPETTTTRTETTTTKPETTTTAPETTTTTPETTTTTTETSTTTTETTTTTPETTTTTPETTTITTETITTTPETTATTPETTTITTGPTTTTTETTTTTPKTTTTTTPETTTTTTETTASTAEATTSTSEITTIPETTTRPLETTTTTPKTTTTPETTTRTLDTTTIAPETTTTTTETTNIIPKTTTDSSTVCLCPGSSNASNHTVDLDTKLQTIKNTLLVDVKETSAYMRTLTSAPDPRPSAKAVGLVAVAMMVVPFGLILIPDIVRTIRATANLKKR